MTKGKGKMVAKEVDNSSSNSKIDEMKMARETKLKPRYHRHTPHQVKEMEAFFKDCPHPSDKQRRQLGRELGLEPTQVKFWFQNKHNQVKTQYQRIDNMQLRLMNESLRAENKMYKESLCSVACASCGGRFGTGEVSPEELQLRMENEALRKEIYRISTMARMHAGKPLSPA